MIFIGTTSAGGPFYSSQGTLYQMTAAGVVTVVHTFYEDRYSSPYEGILPLASLLQARNGDFYGTTSVGGYEGGGSVFRFTLKPDPPTHLKTTVTSSGHVRISWAPAVRAVSYIVKRRAIGGDEVVIARGGAPFYEDTSITVAPGRAYYYVVEAVNNLGAVDSMEIAAHVRSARNDDYDGDGKTDITVFRPSSGMWYIVQSSTGVGVGLQWASAGDVPVPGDYDGDGLTDVAVFRPSNGTWYVRQSTTWTMAAAQFGNGQDIPVPGDYDGDGKTDIAVFRPSNGMWYIILSSTHAVVAHQWASAGDIPVPGDYDGDGLTDIAVFRPSTGVWYIRQSSTLTMAAHQWASAGDIPVPGDYDGDGKTDIAVFRPSRGTWYVRLSSTLEMLSSSLAFDEWNDPVVGDYDGDGVTDFAAFGQYFGDPSARWFIRLSGGGVAGRVWGLPGDLPLPR